MSAIASTPPPPAQSSSARVAAAKAAYTRGDALAAQRFLRPLIESGGGGVDALCLYAEAALSTGDLAGVAERLANAADLDSPPAVRGRLKTKQSQLLLAQRRDGEALSAALEAVDALPNDVEAIEIFGHALLRSGRADEAALVFKEAIARAGSPSFRCAVGMIQALDKAGHGEAAIEFGDAVKALYPYQTTIDLELSRVQRRLGRHEAAEQRLLSLPSALRNTVEVFIALAEIALATHRDDAAAEWFEKAYKLNPDDPFLRHVTGADRACRAGDDYVRGLFDSYSTTFEQSLLGLGYRVPGLVLRALERHDADFAAGQPIGDVLDLGCGTGLVGVVLHDRIGGRLKGVDLSPGMIEQARAKGIYSELEVAELTAYLEAETTRWRAVIAADVLCYFGELASVVSRVRAILAPGGLFVFSVERHRGPEEWVKQATGRYAHSPTYVSALLSGWQVLELTETVLRFDRGEAVEGLLVVVRAP